MLCIAGANPLTKDKGDNDPISYSKQSGNAACTALLESFVGDKNGESNLRWDRMIDGSTGHSFYYNKDTGKSEPVNTPFPCFVPQHISTWSTTFPSKVNHFGEIPTGVEFW